MSGLGKNAQGQFHDNLTHCYTKHQNPPLDLHTSQRLKHIPSGPTLNIISSCNLTLLAIASGFSSFRTLRRRSPVIPTHQTQCILVTSHLPWTLRSFEAVTSPISRRPRGMGYFLPPETSTIALVTLHTFHLFPRLSGKHCVLGLFFIHST